MNGPPALPPRPSAPARSSPASAPASGAAATAGTRDAPGAPVPTAARGAPAAHTADAPRPVRLADYRPPFWTARTVDLTVQLHEDHALVTSRVLYERSGRPGAPDDGALVLDGVALQLVSIELDGRPLPATDYRIDERSLALDPLAGAPDRERFELTIVTRIEPQANTTLEGLYRSGEVFCTQMEAQGFRRVTWFLDRPDVLAVYTTTIEADRRRYPVLLSNGNPVEACELPAGRHRVRWHDPFPKPCYLFALVAGDLAHVTDHFVTRSGRRVELFIYCDQGNESRLAHAMDSLKRAMAWDERAYGREYDLDRFMIVAIKDFNLGAMENKGLNLFNALAVLADVSTATDQDFRRIEGVVAHEYFHNWSGNRVTCRDWFQLSLKEGFTVFRDQSFSEEMGHAAAQRIADVRHLRGTQLVEDAGPMAHPVRPAEYIEINNFYTATVYEKGAELIRMLRVLLGPEAFRRGTDLYFERHDGQAVTTDDFVTALQDASGVDLTLFRRWYDQAGTPRLRVRGRWIDAERVYELTVEQSCPPTPGQPHKLPLHVPLAIALIDADGRELPLRLDGASRHAGGPTPTTRVLDVTKARQVFRFSGLERAPVPSLLRGFSAPVRLDSGLTDEQLAFLAIHDTDAFNRWDSFQELARRELLAAAADRAAERQHDLSGCLLDAYTRLVARADDDPALVAAALDLPSEIALHDELAARGEVVDVDAVHGAREAVRTGLAAAVRDELVAIHDRHHGLPYRFDAVSAGRRALKNAALEALLLLGEEPFVERCHAQLVAADNMTDEAAALVLLADVAAPQRAAGLAAFRARWGHDPLVLNKWFSAQAGSKLPDTTDAVRRLARDPAFQPRNPNHVRSLYRTFANNPIQFHAADGRGYALLADVVLDVDARNPILAARLAGAFNTWRRHDARRRKLAEAQLRRILGAARLSPNTFEVVSKALA